MLLLKLLRVLMIHICIQEHDINAAEEERKNAIEAIKPKKEVMIIQLYNGIVAKKRRSNVRFN